MRKRSLPLALALMAMFATTSVVASGGWAQVTAKGVPVDPPVGEETTIELQVMQHGVTPVSWPDLTVIATDATSGAVVRAAATAAVGREGSYLVKITFPSAGSWSLTFESKNLVMEGKAAVHVVAAAAAAPVSGAAAFDVMPLLFALLAIGGVLVAFGLALRGRGARVDVPVSVRS